jgi:hypothetical protein
MQQTIQLKTPKEKAKELVEKFLNNAALLDQAHAEIYALIDNTDPIEDALTNEFKYLKIYTAKECAWLTVNEIFEHIDYIFQELEKDKLPNKFDDEIEYWQEVKKEIELYEPLNVNNNVNN